jgi:hypothetical protein
MASRPINNNGTRSGMPRLSFALGKAVRCSIAVEIA